ncbi:MAG: HypC/HybG/HupF family hydrogenase formation chaperone [bacterium]|nr:HypC/HybG/HupF family hydrogenase formation chaperone [bacterium]
MCLAVPMKIIEINGASAVAESKGVKTAVNIAMSPDLQINDKVLVHAGFVIEKLDEEAALEIEKVWDEYLTILEEEDKEKQVS